MTAELIAITARGHSPLRPRAIHCAVLQDANATRALIEAIASGAVPLKDLAGLSHNDLDAIARLGASALQGGRLALALEVFTGLEALDPEQPLHVLHQAVVHKAAGRRAEAIDAVTRFLDADLPKGLPDAARALLLRAELLGATDKEAAARDLMAARALAQHAPEVKRIIEEAL